MDNEKKAFYERGWFTVLMLIVFFPVGLFLMWKFKKFNMVVRVIISTVLGISLLGNMTSPDEKSAEPAPQVVADAVSEPVLKSESVEKKKEKPVAMEKEKKQPKNPRLTVGESEEIEGITITLNSIREAPGSDFLQPKNGKYILADVTIENDTSKEYAVSSFLNFSLRDADGYKHNITLYTDAKGSVDGSVASGEMLRGEVAFDVPESAQYELVFEEFWTSGKAVWEFTN